jgi:hypothetical protein
VAKAAKTGLWSMGRHTARATRPPGARTRQASRNASGWSVQYCRPCWQQTTSKAPSGSGSAAASARCHAIPAGRSAAAAAATSSMPSLTSAPAPPSPARAGHDPGAAGHVEHTVAGLDRDQVEGLGGARGE